MPGAVFRIDAIAETRRLECPACKRRASASAELADRRGRLLDHAGTTVVLFDQAYIQYYTGFNFLSNERPVVVVVGDELTAFVPGFEVERTEAEGHFDRVEQYPEYPGDEHPMTGLARFVTCGPARRRPGRLPGDPRLRGAGAVAR